MFKLKNLLSIIIPILFLSGPLSAWAYTNKVAGTQYQINKHFIPRGELGFSASRTRLFGGLHFRFDL